jgi:flavin-dependent dehydrogenase
VSPSAQAGRDVLVIGAGLAGTTAAIALARLGLSVLLVDDGAGGGDHDLLISGQALRALDSLGLRQPPRLRPVRSIRIRFSRATRRITDSAAAAVSGRRLGEALRQTATGAGAELLVGTVTDLEPAGTGHRAAVLTARSSAGPGGRPPGTPRRTWEITARHVIMATGSDRSLAGWQPPGGAGPVPLAGVACARRFTGPGLRGTALLALMAPDVTAADAPPTCAWAIPAGGDAITVGAARVGAEAIGVTAADLLDQALGRFADSDGRFAGVTPAGPLVSGRLDVGFTPERIASARCLLVGDAAGLVNPFTGEGLNLAFQSGLMAASAIAENPSDARAAREAHADQLSASFVGYFEAARHAARRYHLTWRVLDGTADSEHPFFVKTRRVVLEPEGLGALSRTDHIDLGVEETIMIAPLLAACDEVMVTTIREEWPFLARMAMADDAAGSLRLRPSVLFFGALLAGGRTPQARYAMVAAGIELAQLGALTFLGPPSAHPHSGRGVDWAVATTVLAGDFLLAQASRLVAESAPEVSWSFADWLLELITFRDSHLGPDGAVSARELFASLFEFPARIGALLGAASDPTIEALRDVGSACGRAFLHAEDILALRGERTRLDAALPAMLRGRISAVPEYLAGTPVSLSRLTRDPDLRSRALRGATSACLTEREQAIRALAGVDQTSQIIYSFIAAVTKPADSDCLG